jgi:hypothetical protein
MSCLDLLCLGNACGRREARPQDVWWPTPGGRRWATLVAERVLEGRLAAGCRAWDGGPILELDCYDALFPFSDV